MATPLQSVDTDAAAPYVAHPGPQPVNFQTDSRYRHCANIFMLELSSHAWKVNFCKFTNETQNGIEDSLTSRPI